MRPDNRFADLLEGQDDAVLAHLVEDLDRVHTEYLSPEQDAAISCALGLSTSVGKNDLSGRAIHRRLTWKLLVLPLVSVTGGFLFTASTLSAAWNAAQSAPPSALDTLSSLLDSLPPDKKAAVLLHLNLGPMMQSVASAHPISVSYTPILYLVWISLVVINVALVWAARAV